MPSVILAFPGLRINIRKSGISTSIGVPGATVNLGARGLTTTVGIPGTGLSYSSRLPAAGPRAPRGPALVPPQALPRQEPTFLPAPGLPRSDQPNVWIPQPGMRAIAFALSF